MNGKKYTVKDLKNSGLRGVLVGGIFVGGFALLGHFDSIPTLKEKQDSVIGDFRAYDINKDDLIDLVGKEGNIYLQTKEGNFILYEDAIQEEKAKIDPIYQAKQNSFKRVYENKLEKISGGNK